MHHLQSVSVCSVSQHTSEAAAVNLTQRIVVCFNWHGMIPYCLALIRDDSCWLVKSKS